MKKECRTRFTRELNRSAHDFHAIRSRNDTVRKPGNDYVSMKPSNRSVANLLALVIVCRLRMKERS